MKKPKPTPAPQKPNKFDVDDQVKRGLIQRIGLPPAIRIGLSAQETVRKLAAMRRDYGARSQLRDIANEALNGLYEIAFLHNDKKAASEFLTVLVHGISLFAIGTPLKIREQGYTHPVFQKIASESSTWPGLLTVDRDQQAANQEIIKLLGLGKNAPLNFKQKQWSRKTLEVRIALYLLEHREYRLDCNKHIDPYDPEDGRRFYDDSKFKRLGPLTRLNSKSWWQAFGKMFAAIYGEDCENHKEFSGYWNKDVYKEAVPGKPGEKRLVRNAPALIRRDIKKAVQQAFHSIAPKPQVVG